jgi:hypothetical protein
MSHRTAQQVQKKLHGGDESEFVAKRVTEKNCKKVN